MILATVIGALGLILLVSLAAGVTRIAETLEKWRTDELRREAEAAIYNADVTPIDRRR